MHFGNIGMIIPMMDDVWPDTNSWVEVDEIPFDEIEPRSYGPANRIANDEAADEGAAYTEELDDAEMPRQPKFWDDLEEKDQLTEDEEDEDEEEEEEDDDDGDDDEDEEEKEEHPKDIKLRE